MSARALKDQNVTPTFEYIPRALKLGFLPPPSFPLEETGLWAEGISSLITLKALTRAC